VWGDSGETSPPSAMTAAALADEGHGIGLAGADPYVLGQVSPRTQPAAHPGGQAIRQ
jgi:hypothetical protein